MTLWKHICDVCHRTVCDDCAPRNTESVDAKGEKATLRVCKTCGTTGHRLGSAVGGHSAADGAQGTGAARPDPHSEAERERRARIIEERSRAQKNRGRPQRAGGEGDSRAAVASERPAPPARAPSSPTSAPPRASASPPAAPPPLPANSGSQERLVNPALEAAMRRQQQQQAHGRTAPTLPAANMSPEKTRLLCEIEALLAKHLEDPPFGLRAADEAKLHGYLQFLKKKYHLSE
ncbi:conserved hypothetical protein [Leishmania major strain Friedlin]|uniref:FYVE-type domain-containing protein n=1 Tax=Leishmania major TaxID=5664 RepID=Q4Q1H7_LEIMA|nr:conserved hypothetical protein [Leishmania major strain Friedlin]CAG9583776.1 FYVE_zinc_finger_containing_protein_-_putative [Leishmania major strain Friedlin]CAJ09202.1 conserved hypothetical protein [Leishmania major strain Friedlin]|eukprot:XP_001686821.1 conserved hypothetical protein [Leishmania major strain Friedlin]